MMYRLFLWLERWPFDVALVAARCTLAFFIWQWMEGETGLTGLRGAEFINAVRELTTYGFTGDRAAELVTWGGIAVGVILATGFATRLAAALLGGMLLWLYATLGAVTPLTLLPLLALLLLLITRGGGRLAIDYFLLRR